MYTACAVRTRESACCMPGVTYCVDASCRVECCMPRVVLMYAMCHVSFPGGVLRARPAASNKRKASAVVRDVGAMPQLLPPIPSHSLPFPPSIPSLDARIDPFIHPAPPDMHVRLWRLCAWLRWIVADLTSVHSDRWPTMECHRPCSERPRCGWRAMRERHLRRAAQSRARVPQREAGAPTSFA